MPEQLALAPTQQTADVDRPRTPTEKWDAFVAANPHAKPEIIRTTRALLDAGRRATANVVWEELRHRVHTTGDPYRWDNSLRAPMGAWMRDEHPDLAVHMRTRRDRHRG